MHWWHHNSTKNFGQARQCMGIMTLWLRLNLARSLLWKFEHPKFWLLFSKPVGNAQPSYISIGTRIGNLEKKYLKAGEVTLAPLFQVGVQGHWSLGSPRKSGQPWEAESTSPAVASAVVGLCRQQQQEVGGQLRRSLHGHPGAGRADDVTQLIQVPWS